MLTRIHHQRPMGSPMQASVSAAPSHALDSLIEPSLATIVSTLPMLASMDFCTCTAPCLNARARGPRLTHFDKGRPGTHADKIAQPRSVRSPYRRQLRQCRHGHKSNPAPRSHLLASLEKATEAKRRIIKAKTTHADDLLCLRILVERSPFPRLNRRHVEA